MKITNNKNWSNNLCKMNLLVTKPTDKISKKFYSSKTLRKTLKIRK